MDAHFFQILLRRPAQNPSCTVQAFFICFIGFLSSAEFTGRICKNIFISRHLQTFCLFLLLICQICNLCLLPVNHGLPGLLFNNSHTSCSSSSLAIYPCSFSSSCCLLDSFLRKAAHTGWLALPALSALHRSQSGCPAPASLKPVPSLRVLCMPPPAKADHFFEFFLGFIYLCKLSTRLGEFHVMRWLIFQTLKFSCSL